jgi:hypothetical protein
VVLEGLKVGGGALIVLAVVAVVLNEILAVPNLSLPDGIPVWLLVLVLLLLVIGAGEAITGGLEDLFGF